jgi:hypothetical protein
MYREQLLRSQPDLVVYMVGDESTPLKGTLDPEILCWCEENNCLLVTNNRRSMPRHLQDHLAIGRHIPGIFALRRQADIRQVIEDLILIALVSEEGEYSSPN